MMIDYMTLTKKFDIDVQHVQTANMLAGLVCEEVLGADLSAEFMTVKPARFYAYAFEIKPSFRIDVAKNTSHQGVKVTIGGQMLQMLDQRNLVERVVFHLYKATRIDIAYDILNEKFSVADIWKRVVADEGLDGKRSKQFIDGKTGQTMYLGSRTSERFARLYDKGKQTGMIDGTWLRWEVEYKGTLASLALDSLYQRDGTVWHDAIETAPAYTELRTFLERTTGYEREGQGFTVGRKDTDALKWWKKTIMPSYQKMLDNDYEAGKKVLDMMLNIMVNYQESKSTDKDSE